MTPKEEAIDLVQEFYNITSQDGYYEEFKEAKECALICVDDKIQMIIKLENNKDIGNYWFFDDILYELREVKQEINKLEL